MDKGSIDEQYSALAIHKIPAFNLRIKVAESCLIRKLYLKTHHWGDSCTRFPLRAHLNGNQVAADNKKDHAEENDVFHLFLFDGEQQL
jgi:hypothetical protein